MRCTSCNSTKAPRLPSPCPVFFHPLPVSNRRTQPPCHCPLTCCEDRGAGHRGNAPGGTEAATDEEMAGPSNFKFFKILLPGMYEEALRLPTKFSELLGDRRELKLRLSGGEMMPLWHVEVSADSRGGMCLLKGWEKFARAHDLRVGYTLAFRYDDDRGQLVVTVFDLTTCRKEYAGAVVGGNNTPGAGAGVHSLPIVEPSRFAVTIRQCNLKARQDQYLNVPAEFQDAHGYVRRRQVELQMGGRPWTVTLKRNKRQDGGYRSSFRYGWRQFCVDNAIEVGDMCFFRVIRERSICGEDDEEWEPEEEDDEHVLKVEVYKKNGTFVY